MTNFRYVALENCKIETLFFIPATLNFQGLFVDEFDSNLSYSSLRKKIFSVEIYHE